MEPEPNPISRARTYDAALSRPGLGTYRAVGEHFGVTAAEVCQYLSLLRKLPTDIVAAVEHENDPRRLRVLSLRQMRALCRLPSEERQRAAFAKLLAAPLPYHDRVPVPPPSWSSGTWKQQHP
jgi:hypothetical protein